MSEDGPEAPKRIEQGPGLDKMFEDGLKCLVGVACFCEAGKMIGMMGPAAGPIAAVMELGAIGSVINFAGQMTRPQSDPNNQPRPGGMG